MNCLLNELLFEIKKRCRDENEAKAKSGLYRLFLTYLKYSKEQLERKEKQTEVVSSYEMKRLHTIWKNELFLSKLLSGKSHSVAEFEVQEEEKIKVLEEENQKHGRYYEGETFYEFLQYVIEELQNENHELQGYHTKQDVLNSKQITVDYFRPYRFKTALVFGIKMDSRGMECSEQHASNPENGLMVNNGLNNLQLNWNNSKSVSCWFKYRYNSKSFLDTKFGCIDNLKIVEVQQGASTVVTKFLKDEFCFGQFNYFFRINLPSEPLLNGLPMASAVCRKATMDCYMQTIDILSSLNASFLSQKRFVTLTNVYSTKILVGGRDNLKMPIQLKINYSDSQHETTTRNFSNCQPNEVSDLILLDLHPERQSVQYDNLNNCYYRFEFVNQNYG
jgi:hypothetical protein